MKFKNQLLKSNKEFMRKLNNILVIKWIKLNNSMNKVNNIQERNINKLKMLRDKRLNEQADM